MSSLTEAAVAAVPHQVERRRHGRPETVSPQLIPLLRGQTDAWMTTGHEGPSVGMGDHDFRDKPGLNPLAFRGIAIAMLFAIPLWGAMGLFVEWVVTTN